MNTISWERLGKLLAKFGAIGVVTVILGTLLIVPYDASQIRPGRKYQYQGQEVFVRGFDDGKALIWTFPEQGVVKPLQVDADQLGEAH